MLPRYPAPRASAIWSDQLRMNRLKYITDVYTIDQMRREDRDDLIDAILESGEVQPHDVRYWEGFHGHEIVGFLAAYLVRFGTDHRDIDEFVHYGLTSSDLVEYDLFNACYDHAHGTMCEIDALVSSLSNQGVKAGPMLRAGRTHGQTAELTSLSHQLLVHVDVFERIRLAFHAMLSHGVPTKTPGPTGYSSIRETILQNPVNSTQVIPRDHLLEWATLYLRLSNALENLALFVRLGARSEIGEFAEGAERQGSSAMPGKKNPIDSEKVCGLSRVVRGHFLTLAENCALWEDRDLTNSSTERITVPEMAGTVEHMLAVMTKVMDNLVIDVDRITENAADPRTRANVIQSQIMKTEHVGPIAASRIATERGLK